MKTEMIRARVDADLKQDVEGILDSLGMTQSAAITLFYRQILLHNGLPFAVRLPRDETRQAIDEAMTGRNLHSHDSPDALFAALKETACASNSPRNSPRATRKRTKEERTSES
ncbi:type II toxin-antitoxin system RelB/DinJ family antitoxin [Desulfolutivibrio sp.]|uniref:type II toxin-antitoxin system RelB/DinJ family antitoxin n=1 Tax=Desulfolutivibrio sp. TaxID=2773296 RepID=UPI002F963BC1